MFLPGARMQSCVWLDPLMIFLRGSLDLVERIPEGRYQDASTTVAVRVTLTSNSTTFLIFPFS